MPAEGSHAISGHHGRCPDPGRPAARLTGRLHRRRSRRHRHQGGAGTVRPVRCRPAVRDHGPGAAGGGGPDPGPAGRGGGRHPDDRARDHHQQGLPVRPGRDRARRPADPGGRVRHRGGRGDGVDDPGTAPAAGVTYRAQVRRHRAAGRHGARRPDGRVRPFPDGRAHRRPQRPAGHRPRRAGRVRGPLAPARRRRHQGRAAGRRDRPGPHPAAPGGAGPVRHRRGRPAGHDGRGARQAAARVRGRTARSRRARPRRSPTAPAPWW